MTFDCSQPRRSSDCQPPESSIQSASSATSEADVQLSPLAADQQEAPFTDVYTQLGEEEEEEVAKERKEDKKEEVEEREVGEERVREEYALSSTLRMEEKEEEQADER